MNGDHAHEWIRVDNALAQVDAYEREGRTILGIELARMTPDEKVLLPAFADFSPLNAEETWSFARELLSARVPPDVTHVTSVV